MKKKAAAKKIEDESDASDKSESDDSDNHNDSDFEQVSCFFRCSLPLSCDWFLELLVQMTGVHNVMPWFTQSKKKPAAKKKPAKPAPKTKKADSSSNKTAKKRKILQGNV